MTSTGGTTFKSIRSIIGYVKKHNIELVHLVDLKSTIVGGMAALFLKNVKTVTTIHGLPEPFDTLLKRSKYQISVWLYYFFLKFIIDGIICVSSDLKSRQPKGIEGKKIRVVYNGLKLDDANKINDPGLTEKGKGQLKIGTVGRLDRVKGHSFLLDAAQIVLKERPDVVFVIVGSGPLEDELKGQARQLGISDKVHFLGFKENAHELIAEMDIFVLSSLHEGVPYVLLEAMSSFKPVVCTQVGGIKDVVVHGHDGLFVQPADSEDLSRALLLLLNDRKLAANLGENARRTIENRFSSVHMAKETCDFYGALKEQK